MTMITLEKAIAKIKKLPVEQRNEVIKFVEFLEFKLDNIEQSQEQTELEKKEVSFTEVAKEFKDVLKFHLLIKHSFHILSNSNI